MPAPNFEVTQSRRDASGRLWVTVRRSMSKDQHIEVPAYACLHDEDEGLWRISPGRHVYIHPETIRFHTQPDSTIPDK